MIQKVLDNVDVKDFKKLKGTHTSDTSRNMTIRLAARIICKAYLYMNIYTKQ